MERWYNRVAVVTGASSGIGAAVLKDLAKAGMVVVGLAHSVEKVEQIKSSLPRDQRIRVYALQCDVSSEKSVDNAFEWIVKTLGGVDILVNNAEIFSKMHLATMPLSEVRKAVDTNLIGAVACTQHAVKSMRARKVDGHIVIVNSIFGHAVPVLPGERCLNIYPSTKHALTAMAEVLRQEFNALGAHNVKITSISPGVVYTELIDEDERDHWKDIALRPEDISNGVLYALSTPPHVQVKELTIKAMREEV